MKLKTIAAIVTISVPFLSAYADENGQNVFYLGSGVAKSGDVATTSNKSPFTVGYLRLSNVTDAVIGGDISGEGTMLDSSWGQNRAVKQATSFNLLLGKNLGRTENSRFDASLILGIREKTLSCPASYLGFQCYANSAPSTSYAFNGGVTLTMTFQSVLIGLRAASESTQVLVGYKF